MNEEDKLPEVETALNPDTDFGTDAPIEPVFALAPETVPEVAPVFEPTAELSVEPAEPTIVEPKEANTPGVIIMQWLSYAFWGWLILALIWLIGVVLANAILGSSVSEMIPYAIAAGVVLLPIAFLTDFFYRKHEPTKKVGVAMIIMVIHAVLFALLAIVALIVTVFNSLNALIEASTSIDGQLVTIFTALGATILYAAAFIRVLKPFKTSRAVFLYSIAMVAATLILIVLAIVGPLVQTFATKEDRRIEQNLSSVSQAVNDYIQTNEKLPTNLTEVTYSNEAADLLVNDGLVRYKAQKSVTNQYNTDRVEHRYQLCVTYKEKDAINKTSYSYGANNNDYSSYLRVSGHTKGEVCYKLSETTATTKASFLTPKGAQLEGTVLN